MATGKLRSLGLFRQQELESGDSGPYAVGNDYLAVNQDSVVNAPIAAIKAPAVR